MTAISEAAERYRRGNYPEPMGDGKKIHCLLEDTIDLAEAYLAEHPADENEPITIEWLMEIGLCDHRCVLDLFKEPDGSWFPKWHGWELARIKTRAELRALCGFLQIKLTA